jgi:nucleoside-diphosphate-sugar epimerase
VRRSGAIERVVVTGGSGRLGRCVLGELCGRYDIVNADVSPGESVPFARVDVTDLAAVRAVVDGADAVCHVAGLDLDRNGTPEDFFRVNALGSWHVLQAAAEANVRRVVLTSSVAACGLSEMRSDWLPQYLPVDEQHECRPVHPYSVSKLLVEQMGASVAYASDMSVICLRPVAVVVPETLADYVAFVDHPERRWLFYYVTATDVARAYALALEAETPRYGRFFLSAADTSRPEATLDWYAERVGPLPALVDVDRYVQAPRASVFSTEAARAVLGWAPTSDFSTLRSQLDNGH